MGDASTEKHSGAIFALIIGINDVGPLLGLGLGNEAYTIMT
jgi:hypothetical protein